jgi:hypothetical protein
MGSLSANHSHYPPVNQLFFAFRPFLVLILWLELGMRIITPHSRSRNPIFWLQIIENLGLKKCIFLVSLNPLVIVELSGNLHFEAWCYSFVWSMYLLHENKWKSAADDLAVSYLFLSSYFLYYYPYFFKS